MRISAGYLALLWSTLQGVHSMPKMPGMLCSHHAMEAMILAEHSPQILVAAGAWQAEARHAQGLWEQVRLHGADGCSRRKPGELVR